MNSEMRKALDERSDLIEARADAVLNRALDEKEPWTAELGPPPTDATKQAAWRRSARVVAAYRDRYQVTADTALGAPVESIAQRFDTARARRVLDAARRLAISSMPKAKVKRPAPSSGRTL